MKSLHAVTALSLVMAVGCAEHPLATEPPAGSRLGLEFRTLTNGCPEQFNLASWKFGEEPDRNGDGAICEHVVYLTNEKLVTYIDNNIPANQLGGCPNNFIRQFYMMTEEGFHPRDRNENGQLCTMTAPGGQVVVIDDNVV